MKNWEELISSGILELYVLGETSPEENQFIESMATLHEEVRQEIENIEHALENFAIAHSVTPDPIGKPFLMASIDYMERIKKGEPISNPPLLTEHSTSKDYEVWLKREDMTIPDNHSEDVYAKIINYTKEFITAIVWVKHLAPQEVHDDQHERFLILEGTCTIYVENDAFDLKPGDFFSIPLHKKHHIQITSPYRCKVILQRVAA